MEVRLAAIVESADHVCCRYRLRAFQPFFERHGHALELVPLPRSLMRRWMMARALDKFDAVILQRKLLSKLDVAILGRYSRRLLFDIDDAVWLRDSYSPKGLDSPRRLSRFHSIVRNCDVVIAGNSYLAIASGPQAIVIPTCVDVKKYTLAPHARAPGNAELVWVGSSSTLRGLEAVSPMLEALGTHVPDIVLKLICDRFLDLKQLAVRPCPWNEETEAGEIAAADIGISWLPDDPWSRGKCGLKVLQYMAAGLPVVANPVGVQSEMIRHGETGFLASSIEEWSDAVRTLANDPELRRRMGAAGRRLVERHYSVEAGATKWLTLLNGLQRGRVSA